MDNLQSLLRWVTTILTRTDTILRKDEIYGECNLNGEVYTAEMEHDPSNGMGDNKSDGQSNNPGVHKPTMVSGIMYMWQMMKEQ